MGALDVPLGMIACGWSRRRRHSYDPRGGFRITCRGCGESHLKWEHTPDGWRLFESTGARHKCKKDTYEDGRSIYETLGPNLRHLWDMLETETELDQDEIVAFIQELKTRCRNPS